MALLLIAWPMVACARQAILELERAWHGMALLELTFLEVQSKKNDHGQKGC